ncbi:phosphorylase family protein, partial [Actinoallomurus acaciae]
MRLLVCAPLAMEARAVRHGLPVGPPEALVIRTGLGARRAPYLHGCDAMAVTGFGGALDATLRPGDVLVATEVWFEDRRFPCAAPETL